MQAHVAGPFSKQWGQVVMVDPSCLESESRSHLKFHKLVCCPTVTDLFGIYDLP